MKAMQSNPLSSENPCPLTKPQGTVKTRGISAYDLLKSIPTLKVKRTQKEQQANRPQFDHPKILHILIDRASGFGCSTLAKRHGGSKTRISKFCKYMGFDQIDRKDQLLSNGESKRKSAQQIYEEEWMKEVRSVKKGRTWAYHPAYINWYNMERYYADPAAHNKRCQDWKSRNRDKVNTWTREWKLEYYRKNPSAKIADKLRIRLNQALKAQLAGKQVSAVDCGCSMDFLVNYLEQRFQPGMTWDNYGLYGWHIDHIKPCASFDLTKKSEQKKCCHYTNLQPMWAEDNIKKSDMTLEQQFLF